ncbi:uncharacterized protein DNG_01632 [Cephalotrichum gorgonifer]|uniref:Uncharacterized protein n=1 Tax=Cephalotrichum gorgonifer TaxID=2041049 RepID=A0AAE8SSG5_9PEZI|nr:uncharacterized protein DNG_01632 [Cephalotrichum gorgonifer]
MDQRPESPTDVLTAQHLRLFLGLLPFKDPPEFLSWINRPPTQSAWSEFAASVSLPHQDPGLTTLLPKVRDAVDASSLPEARTRLMYPDKRDWNSEDHHVRFIVGVICDSLLEELWTEKEWVEDPDRIVRAVYEVLVYLKGCEALGVRPLDIRPMSI